MTERERQSQRDIEREKEKERKRKRQKDRDREKERRIDTEDQGALFSADQPGADQGHRWAPDITSKAFASVDLVLGQSALVLFNLR